MGWCRSRTAVAPLWLVIFLNLRPAPLRDSLGYQVLSPNLLLPGFSDRYCLVALDLPWQVSPPMDAGLGRLSHHSGFPAHFGFLAGVASLFSFADRPFGAIG